MTALFQKIKNNDPPGWWKRMNLPLLDEKQEDMVLEAAIHSEILKIKKKWHLWPPGPQMGPQTQIMLTDLIFDQHDQRSLKFWIL